MSKVLTSDDFPLACKHLRAYKQMSMYAKLMSRITESSLMDEELPVRYCFMMMLAIADQYGYVIGTDVAIARRMNIPTEDFKRYIKELMKPDPDSNSKEEEGRRVILSDAERGYFLVNYRKYRDTRDEEQRREYMREYMRNYRSEKDVTRVNSGKQRKVKLANAEAEADSDAKTESDKPKGTAAKLKRCSREELMAYAVEKGLPASDGESVFETWEANGWMIGNNPIQRWKSAFNTRRLNGWLPSIQGSTNGKSNGKINGHGIQWSQSEEVHESPEDAARAQSFLSRQLEGED